MSVCALRQAVGRDRLVTATTGADHISADWLAAHDIPLLTLKGQYHVLNSLTPAERALLEKARAALLKKDPGSR